MLGPSFVSGGQQVFEFVRMMAHNEVYLRCAQLANASRVGNLGDDILSKITLSGVGTIVKRSLNTKTGAEGHRALVKHRDARAGERHQLVGHQMNEQVRHRAVQALEGARPRPWAVRECGSRPQDAGACAARAEGGVLAGLRKIVQVEVACDERCGLSGWSRHSAQGSPPAQSAGAG